MVLRPSLGRGDGEWESRYLFISPISNRFACEVKQTADYTTTALPVGYRNQLSCISGLYVGLGSNTYVYYWQVSFLYYQCMVGLVVHIIALGGCI